MTDVRSLLSTPEGLAALLLGATLTTLMIWWPLDFGAFFPTVLYPGLILLLAVLGLLLPTSPLPLAGRGPYLIALGAILSLSGWTLLSAIWSPTPDAALEDAIRTAGYAAAFFAALWLTVSIGRRAAVWSLAPVILGGGIVVAVVLAEALLADNAESLLSGDGTLDHPLGYRNANAAFFLVLFWTAAGAASRAGFAVAVRSLCGAVAAGSLALAVMSQSRGSILACVAALAVFIITAGDRRRAVLALLATAVPVGLAVPILIEPFDAVGTSADALPGLHHAAVAAVAASAVAALTMAVVVMIERRLKPRQPARIRPRPGTAAVLGAAFLALILVVTAVADPRDWIGDRISEFEENSLPELTTAESRFTVSASSTRSDYWRIALAGFTDRPLLGAGAGGFKFDYLRDRDTQDTPRDAHSAPLEVLGELGLPGLLLLLTGLGAAVIAALRSRRFGSDATLLTSIALTVTAYWAVHASIDWFWSYPIPTGVAFLLLGCAAAASSTNPRGGPSRAVRWTVLAATIVFSLAVIPLYFSERLTVLGVQDSVAGEIDNAYRQLDSAADLDPLSDTSLLAAAEIARREGDDVRALAALDEAQSRQPDNYLTYFIRARLLADSNPREALDQLEIARELNPRDEQLSILADRLSRDG